jgi:hypothetical protein
LSEPFSPVKSVSPLAATLSAALWALSESQPRVLGLYITTMSGCLGVRSGQPRVSYQETTRIGLYYGEHTAETQPWTMSTRASRLMDMSLHCRRLGTSSDNLAIAAISGSGRGSLHAHLMHNYWRFESWYDGLSHGTHGLRFVIIQMPPILWDIQSVMIACGCIRYITMDYSGGTIHMLTFLGM